ncbi:ABC transporter permease [Oscillospiraceae bacterium MB08-C2-2]|nr:ABC transporter permease [Oscillospiraceae bacterium MB08-C2-2]
MRNILTKPAKIKTPKEVEKQFNFLRIILAVGIALGIAMIIILLISDDPLGAIYSFVVGPLTTKRRMGNVIEIMTPLIFTGVGVCFIFSANQTNMAVEGGFLLGALGATVIATTLQLPPVLHPLFSMLLGGIFGMLACAVPAGLYVKFGSKPVVSSIMVNWTSLYIALGVINHILRDPSAGFLSSYKIAKTAELPGILKGTNIHAGIIIAAIVVVFGYLYLYKSKFGYEIRTVGKNPEFAAYSGIPVNGVIMKAQLIGGFLAGLGGAVELLGMYSRFQYQGQTGHGFNGILVGIIAGYNPKLVPFAALFLAYVQVGADVMQRSSDIPIELVNIIQAIIIMLVVAERFLHKTKHKQLVKAANAQLEMKGAAVNE